MSGVDIADGVLAMVNAYQNIVQIWSNRDGSHPEQKVVEIVLKTLAGQSLYATVNLINAQIHTSL